MSTIYAVAECLSNTIVQIREDGITDLSVARLHKKGLEVLCKNRIVILMEVE